VSLECKFVEISQEDAKAVGFDWHMGNWLARSGSIGTQAGTAPSYVGTPSPANPTGIFPGAGGPGTIPPAATDGFLTQGLRNEGITTLATVSGILTDPQFRVVIKAMEQRNGVEVMSAPKVVTVSGRQAQIQVNTIRSIATGVAAGGIGGVQGTAGGTGGGGGGVTASTSQVTPGVNTGLIANPVPIIQPQSVPLPTGPTLDVLPFVSADGYTIQMALIPSIIDFLGYGNPDIPEAAEFERTLSAQAGVARAPVPLPRFLVRQVTTSAIVWDGQTVVLGGLISNDVRRRKDKVPIFGDLPLFGRLFRSESNSTSKKNLVVFVTPTIVDPAGNRVFTDDNLPFDPKTIPEAPGDSAKK
jgi:general secretion pathway protein D